MDTYLFKSLLVKGKKKKFKTVFFLLKIFLKIFKVKIHNEMKFQLTEKDNSIFYSRIDRSFYFYNGLKKRLDNLYDEYLINHVNFKNINRNLKILDIGANIGEFSVSMRMNFPESSIFSIEPCKPEYNCLLENSQKYDLFPFMIGISDKDEILKLVDRNSSGDSVFLRKNINLIISDNEKTYDVNCINLTSFCSLNHIDHIDLLKIEAEGQEPEVLSGIDFSNIFIDYITVDVGPERGDEKSDTHNSVREILEKSNFSQIKFNKKRKIALFKNQNK